MTGRPEDFETEHKKLLMECEHYVQKGLKKRRSLEMALKASLGVDDEYHSLLEENEGLGKKVILSKALGCSE
jgi:hypothetical protein